MPRQYDTKTIQRLLHSKGFNPGKVDGIFGPRTSAAVIAFKKSIGYRARDYVGPLTWDALHTSYTPVTPQTEAKYPWLVEGYKVKGWHEDYDRSRLIQWLRSDQHALGDPSVLPWCGDFVDTCLRLGLPNEPRAGDLARNPYWALNWRGFGIACQPTKGAVCSIPRNGGGHVGFLVGQDATRYYLLGGNQANRVSVAPMEKSRFSPESFRWPVSYKLPDAPLIPWMTSDEASSINEA